MNRKFGDIPNKYAALESASILLQSFPYDGTSTWGKGADHGFEAFLDAADNMELYDIETNTEVYRKGIYITEELGSFSSPADMFEKTYNRAKELLSWNKFLTFFGGEHSVSIGIIKAFYEQYSNLTVLHLDAHADLRAEYAQTRYNHACAVYDASKNCNLVQVGIRSMDLSEREHMDFSKVFFAEEIIGDVKWMDNSILAMTDDVYITLGFGCIGSIYYASDRDSRTGWLELVYDHQLFKACIL